MKSLSAFIIGIILLLGCTEDDSVQPPIPLVDPFALCGNGEPISQADSMIGLYPWARYRISQLKISSYNGWWAGEYERFAFASSDIKDALGIFVYDPVADKPIAAYDYAWGHSWSPDGKKLLLMHSFDIYVIDIPSMELHKLTENNTHSLACWSGSGKTIFISKTFASSPEDTLGGTFEIVSNGSKNTFITRQIWNAKYIGVNRLFAVYQDSIRIYNIERDSLVKIYKPEMDNSHPYDLYDISPNGDYIIFQTRRDGSVLDPWGNGIWLMDTETWTARKIRGAQWWNKQYYPTWASSTTFYASMYCRKDSSSMIWEFDLNGEPIRQITTKYMRVWPD